MLFAESAHADRRSRMKSSFALAGVSTRTNLSSDACMWATSAFSVSALLAYENAAALSSPASFAVARSSLMSEHKRPWRGSEDACCCVAIAFARGKFVKLEEVARGETRIF